jgi:hypothetical protein
MCVHKQRPSRLDAGARPQPLPPQSQGDGSDDIGRIGAPKSTPGRPQPTRERHTTPLQPPKPLNSFQAFNVTPFGLVSLKDPSISSDHTPIKSHCDPDMFPTFLTLVNPQQSDAHWSQTGQSEIGARQNGDTMTRFVKFSVHRPPPS